MRFIDQVNMDDCIAIIDMVRHSKSNRQLSPKASIHLLEICGVSVDWSKDIIQDLKNVLNVDRITFNDKWPVPLEALGLAYREANIDILNTKRGISIVIWY